MIMFRRERESDCSLSSFFRQHVTLTKVGAEGMIFNKFTLSEDRTLQEFF